MSIEQIYQRFNRRAAIPSLKMHFEIPNGQILLLKCFATLYGVG
jgi:hypothetical protein